MLGFLLAVGIPVLAAFKSKSINIQLHNPSMMIRVYKAISAVAMMILVLLSAGCTGVPSEGESGWPFSSGASETQTVATPEPTYVTPATPYPTASPTVAKPTFSKPTESEASDPYVTLYNKTSWYNYTTDAYSFDLTQPPLLIDFWVDPVMIKRDKYATSTYGDKDWTKYQQEYPSPNAWFTVTVRDRDTGKILAQDGFGKLYSADTHKQVVVRSVRECLIELSGNEVEVRVLMRAGGLSNVTESV
jgi:hypothetical protein